MQKGRGTKWFIEGDLSACYDSIDHTMLLKILSESFQDNRFIQLINRLLKTGYMENWKYNKSHSRVPQGSIIGPILSNILLDQLDKHVEHILIPANNRGKRRKTNPKYLRLTMQVSMMRKQGNWDQAKQLRQLVQGMPSKDSCDLNYRRLWYVRYADDILVGFAGPKNEAEQIKNEIAKFLNEDLNLMLNEDKTLITHACDSKANFLGYKIYVLHADDKYDHRTQRCINGSIGLRVPHHIKQKKCSEYMRCGKPIHLPQHTLDTAYSIVAQYQTEYRGIVQYYKMAYNLHTLSYLKYVMEVSLVKTLTSKYKTTCRKIYRKFGTMIENDEGEKRKVIQVRVDRLPSKIPLITHFDAVSLK
jgi:hypothetical protein